MRAPGSYAGLTVKQAELLSFLRTEASEQRTPSYDEMRAALSLSSKSGVFRLVHALVDRGYVEHFPYRQRGIVLRQEPQPVKLSDLSIRDLTDELTRRGLKVAAA